MNITELSCNTFEFGCGCNKSKLAAAADPASRRVTVYEVMKDSQSIAEFGTLPEARSKAVEVQGRVKVSSKIVS